MIDWDAKLAAVKNPRGERAKREKGPKKQDGRSLKATGRDVQFNVRMKSRLKEKAAEIAYQNSMSVTEFTERAFEAFIAHLEKTGVRL